MKASEVAKWLMETPDAEVLVRVSNDWCECVGVGPTGFHRNAVSLKAVNVDLGGVIVVDPEMTPHSTRDSTDP